MQLGKFAVEIDYQRYIDVLRKDLNLTFTFKMLKVVPQESLNEQNQVKSIEYAMLMSQVDPSRVHFFDELSVRRITTGNNRRYMVC